MNTLYEEARNIPVADEADVIVIGGGLAGVSAAVAAARNGASVILIEKSIILGGLATLGHVCAYLPIDDGVGNKIYGGLGEELLRVCSRYGFHTIADCWKDGDDVVEDAGARYQSYFNIPAAVCALDELMQNEGVKVVFDTNFCAPVMEGNTCKGVIVENKSGRTAYIGKMFIDASGDADLFFRAGAPCKEERNIVSHWGFELDMGTLKKGLDSGKVMDSIVFRWLGLAPDMESTEGILPMYYGTSSDEVNAYIRTSRKLALEYFKQHQSDDYMQLTLSLMPQYRMTRRLDGKAVFKADHSDTVDTSIGCMIFSLKSPAPVHEFPYEALIDEKITNIAAAGRIVSADGYGWEVARFIPACVLTCEASGTAAAMAIKDGAALQDIDIAKLQAKLTAAGVKIHMTERMRNNGGLPKPQRDPNAPYMEIRRDSLSTKDTH